ncbi:MAG TPA: hypothetical protein VJC08_01180 [bacterium]|nr:hypothetical protein [bacterium]
MKKILVLAHLLILPLLLNLPSALAVSVSFDQEVSVKGNLIASVKVQTKDDRMRAESEFHGMKLVLIHNDKGTFTYNVLQKQATQLPKAVEKTNLTAQLPRYLEFLEKNHAVKTGTEKIDGRECDIYKYTEPIIKRDARAWIWREKKFPLKIEVDSPGGNTVIELKNIQFDPKVTDADFELPKDVKVVELPEMPPAGSGPAATPIKFPKPAAAKQ